MDNPVSTLYLVSVGVLFTSALHAALLAPGSAFKSSCWAFSCNCLVFGLFQLSSAMQYLANNVESALLAHKWVNFFSLLLVPLLAYLVASLEQQRRYWGVYVVAGLTAVLMLYNYFNPLGYRFAALHPRDATTLAWGETVYILSGQPSAAMQLVRLLSLGLLAYIIVFAIKIGKLKERRLKLLMWTSICIMLISSSLASLSDVGALNLPYLGGFGFLFLAGAFFILVRADVSNRKIETQRISGELEQEVHGHQITSKRFQHALQRDTLTELPNRTAALASLHQLLEKNAEAQTKVALFLFDLDCLGMINGTRGHQTGDHLLIEVARRLQCNTRDTDLVARLGGGGFIVGASGLNSSDCVAAMYDKLSAALAVPFSVEGHPCHITSSAGVAMYPDDALLAEALLAAAALALHAAKGSAAGQLHSFDASLKDQLQQRLAFEYALKDALEAGQFFLCYQPQISASDGRTICFEALIRWQHPVHGLVPPDKFIPLTEAMNLIGAIGAWVLDTACAQLSRWHAMGFKQLKIAVNLSAHQLLAPDMEQIIIDTLRRHHLASADLELEITESALITDAERAIDQLTALRRLGVRLSIDDFGTGYSSLNYLRLFPVHAFKLDRSFVHGIGDGDGGKGLEICAIAIQLANTLGLEVVAEGVETLAQQQQLQAAGCHVLQGYFIARPLTVEAANAYLATLRGVPAAQASILSIN